MHEEFERFLWAQFCVVYCVCNAGFILLLGAVHKGRMQSVGGDLTSADKGGTSYADYALFDAKNIGIFKIYGVRTEKGGWASADKEGGGQFFVILCGRPLWTAPYLITLRHTYWNKKRLNCCKELSIKDVRGQEELSSAHILQIRGREFFRYGCPYFWGRPWKTPHKIMKNYPLPLVHANRL